jgi:hypothetical protein
MLQRVTAPFREFGIAAGALYAADRLLQRISPNLRLYAYEFMVQPIPKAPLLRPGLARGFEFKEISAGDPEVALMPARTDIKQQRFEQGAVCLGTFRKTTLIGYAWFASPEYKEDEARCIYRLAAPKQSVFDFDVYLFPEHRMGLGFIAIWHGANEYLRGRGIRQTFSRVARSNDVSRRSHARLGARSVGRAVFFRAWRAQWMLSTLSPYVHLSNSALKCPILTLRAPVESADLQPQRSDE